MKKLKIGIIGCGGIANDHAEMYKLIAERYDNIEVVALADIVPDRAKDFGEKWGFTGARSYNSHTEMLEKETELDGVSICTYNRQHANCAIDALNKGINVLLEKPMCVTLEEGIEMMKAEKASGKILSVGFQPRFHAQMKRMKEIVRSGELGKVYYIQTGGGRRRGIPAGSFITDATAGIGAMGDIGCYALDMVLDAIGYPTPLTVTAFKSDYIAKDPKQFGCADEFEVDDFAAAFIRLEGGVILDFRIAWAMNVNTPGDTIILGTEGGLRIPSTGCWNNGFDAMTLYKSVNGEEIEEVIPVVHQEYDCFYDKVLSFVRAIENNGPAPVPTSQIIKNQAIIDGIQRSAACGKEVTIDIPEV
ncbi:MAG: Gfo/Idh/MocA family oxidoreductase [Clostridia bacterium]|nr:Gfo/Idh/MocA family oxidoreductase [Clostridia bacterium]